MGRSYAIRRWPVLYSAKKYVDEYVENEGRYDRKVVVAVIDFGTEPNTQTNDDGDCSTPKQNSPANTSCFNYADITAQCYWLNAIGRSRYTRKD